MIPTYVEDHFIFMDCHAENRCVALVHFSICFWVSLFYLFFFFFLLATYLFQVCEDVYLICLGFAYLNT